MTPAAGGPARRGGEPDEQRGPANSAGEAEPATDAAEAAPGAGDGSCRKIAFIGAHGVGKTTLCFELAARLKRMDQRVDLVKEVARSCPLPLNRQTTVAAQSWILHTQIAREIEAALDQDWLVCDRSVLDNYAYLVALYGRREPFDQIVREWIGSYTLLAWVPILDRPRYDGVRDTDRAYQQRIDEVIGDLVATFGVEPLRLDPASRGAWIDAVASRLPLASAQLPLFREVDRWEEGTGR